MPLDPLLSRRALLGVGTITLATLSGCADDGDPAPASAPATSDDPDQDLIDRVLDELAGAEQLATAAGVSELALLHRTHIEALDGTPPSPSPGSATMAALQRTERRLQSQLVDASLAAESGGLARLLASMSAAVSQRLVAL
ncbi:hypothetical protein GCM10023350_48940 [Nocardioides endophyticus]|uniref:Uncharacterized protein n=1 Tax=Nocardioides endophyticus TaxID=1353775 RepID=A0ABP8ZJ41_9ACTN